MTTPATTTTTAVGEQLVVGKSTRTTARPSGRGPEATRQHTSPTHRPTTRHRSSTRLAGQVADGRELAVLTDGPWRGRWYWRDDLDAMHTAALRHPAGHPAAEIRTYRPTEQFLPHPHEPDATGRAWRHHPHTTRPATTTRRNP